MSNSYKLRYSLNQYSQSLDRFYEAIQVKDETLAIDGTIQRFEFTFELAWKTIKIFLQHEGILCNSPREISYSYTYYLFTFFLLFHRVNHVLV